MNDNPVFDLSTLSVFTTDLRFSEGPIAVDDGSVLVVEIEGGTLTRVHPDGSKTIVADCGGGPNGAAFGPDGAVYVCNDGGLRFTSEDGIRFPFELAPDNHGGCLQRVDLATGKVDVVFTHCDGEQIGSTNDIVFDPTGSCYFVDTTRGTLYYADPIAGAIREAVSGIDFPNGMGLSPDGGRLYASETYSGRLLVWDVQSPGRLENQSELFNTGGAHGWDGLAIDGAGNICASNLTHSGISVISPAGELLAEFVVPTHDPYVTNICFGGPDGQTAYVCSSGRGFLYSLRWPWPGLRLNFAR